MLIRKGFVSNSSTTSFCVWGVSIDAHSLEFKNVEEFFEDDQVLVNPTPWDVIIVGRSWASVEDHQTGIQFKRQTERLVRRHLKKYNYNKPIKFETIEMGFNDNF